MAAVSSASSKYKSSVESLIREKFNETSSSPLTDICMQYLREMIFTPGTLLDHFRTKYTLSMAAGQPLRINEATVVHSSVIDSFGKKKLDLNLFANVVHIFDRIFGLIGKSVSIKEPLKGQGGFEKSFVWFEAESDWDLTVQDGPILLDLHYLFQMMSLCSVPTISIDQSRKVKWVFAVHEQDDEAERMPACLPELLLNSLHLDPAGTTNISSTKWFVLEFAKHKDTIYRCTENPSRTETEEIERTAIECTSRFPATLSLTPVTEKARVV